MSGGAVYQAALRTLMRQNLPDSARRDVIAILQATSPGPLQFLYDTALEAGLPSDTILARTAAIYFGFCAGHLSDDLSDGECAYIENAYKIGPCTQLTLQNLLFLGLAEAEDPTAYSGARRG